MGFAFVFDSRIFSEAPGNSFAVSFVCGKECGNGFGQVERFHAAIFPDSGRYCKNIFIIGLIAVEHQYGTAPFAIFRGGRRGATLWTPHVVQEALNEATILSLVMCRLGVAFVSGAAQWRCPEGVTLLSVSDLTLSLPFSLVWRKDNFNPLLASFTAAARALPGVKLSPKR